MVEDNQVLFGTQMLRQRPCRSRAPAVTPAAGTCWVSSLLRPRAEDRAQQPEGASAAVPPRAPRTPFLCLLGSWWGGVGADAQYTSQLRKPTISSEYGHSSGKPAADPLSRLC